MFPPKYTLLNVDRVRYSVEESFPFSLEGHKEIVLRLFATIAAVGSERIDDEVAFPATWWQAVRERWCPQWWVRRYPIHMRQISIHYQRYKAVCPHLLTESIDAHLRWMVARQEEP